MNDDTLTLAEAALAAAGRPMMLVSAEELSEQGRRNKLLRCHVASSDIETVIVKQRQDSVVSEAARSGLLRDGAALALLSSIPECEGLAPRFLALDHAHDLLVVEDLGIGESLVEALLGNNAARAEAQLLDAARVLARVHGHTIGRFGAYQALRGSLGPYEPASAFIPVDWPVTIQATLAGAGIEAGDSFVQGTTELLERMRTNAAFFGLLHGDPCPDNWMVTPSGLRLFDFEFSFFTHDGFGLVMLDAVYPRLCFPSCWCAGTTPAAVVERFEAAYRTELATMCPAASDDRQFDEAMLLASAAWFLSTLVWPFPKALQEDSAWGLAGIRARVLTRTAAFLSACQQLGRLPALEVVARQLQDALRERWPEAGALPSYPALTPPA